MHNDLAGILKTIYEWNQKIKNDNYKIKPTLKNRSLANKLDHALAPINYHFEYWTIQDCIFDDSLGRVGWGYATLKGIILGDFSSYVLSNIAKAESIENIKFLNPEGAEDVSVSMVSDVQFSLLCALHKKILLERKISKQEAEIEKLEAELKNNLEHIDSSDTDDSTDTDDGNEPLAKGQCC